MPPVIRKPLGALLLIAALVLYAALVGLASGWIARWPVLVQGLFYLVAGIAWVPALMPLTRWTQTGRFTRPPAPVTADARGDQKQ